MKVRREWGNHDYSISVERGATPEKMSSVDLGRRLVGNLIAGEDASLYP